MDNDLKQKYSDLIDRTIKGEDTSGVLQDILQIKLGAVAEEKGISLAMFDYVQNAQMDDENDVLKEPEVTEQPSSEQVVAENQPENPVKTAE